MNIFQTIISHAQNSIGWFTPSATSNPEPGVFEKIQNAFNSHPEPQKSFSFNAYEVMKNHGITFALIIAVGSVSLYVFRSLKQQTHGSSSSPHPAPGLSPKSPPEQLTSVRSSSPILQTQSSDIFKTASKTELTKPDSPVQTLEEQNLYTSSKKLFTELSEKTKKPVYLIKPHEVSSRYKDFRCPRKTVLPIKNKDGQHLHANLIGKGISDRQFIIAQAPQDYALFWQVVHQHGSFIIDLILSAEIFTTKQSEGVGIYYPLGDKEVTNYGSMNVEREEEILFKDLGCDLSTYNILDMASPDTPRRSVQGLHYRDWLNNKTTVTELITLVNTLDEEGFKSKKYPIVLCRSGNHRSAVVITASIIKEQIKKGIINRDNFDEKLCELILKLREQAGETFVYTADKFHLIRQYGFHLLEKGITD